MYGMLPTRPLSTLLFLMYTLDILYIHHSFPFAIRTTKAQLERKKGCSDTAQIQGFPTATVRGLMLVAPMLNWSHETGRKLH